MAVTGKVLLVDDDQATRDVFQVYGQHSDRIEQFDAVENGIEALRYLRRAHATGEQMPDIIFLDINMPIMNGFAFLDVLKKQSFGEDAAKAIVLMSGRLGTKEARRAAAKGNVKIMAYKPIAVDRFNAITTRCLAAH